MQFYFENSLNNNTKIYNNFGIGVFDEILLYSPDDESIVFTSIIKDDFIGFDGKQYTTLP